MTKKLAKKKKTGKAKVNKSTAKNKFKSRVLDRPDKFDVVSAQTGMTFAQLWHRDASGARKELYITFGKGNMKFGVLEEE